MCDSHGVENTEPESLPTTPVEEPREPLNKTLLIRLILAAVILVVFATFALQNTASVTIEFLSWSFDMSQFLLMVLSAVAGVLIWEFASAYSRHTKKKRS